MSKISLLKGLVRQCLEIPLMIRFRRPTGRKKNYPRVLQLPLTYKCNSRCAMCDIWKMDHSNEAKIDEFAGFVKDPILKEIVAVGINGGEPSLISDLPEYAKELLKLPKIKSLNIISNGFGKKLLLSKVQGIYANCKANSVRFHLSISLDGKGETHDRVRGLKVFERTTNTIDEVIQNQHLYCDSFDIGCTVIKQNADFLVEMEEYRRRKGYDVKYRLGITNKRIGSDVDPERYSVVYDKTRQSAAEFFHYCYSDARDIRSKFKYFAIFSWLTTPKPKRLLGCDWQENGITIDSRGSLYYCAVESKEIGSLRSGSGEDAFFAEKSLEYRSSIITNSCDDCIHDYHGKIELRNFSEFVRGYIMDLFAMKLYRLRSVFL